MPHTDTQTSIDICAQEPIRFPASIQSHGCVMVLDRQGRVLVCSANSAQHLGLEADRLLGQTLWHAIRDHDTWLSHLHGILRRVTPGQDQWLSTVDMAGLPWEVRVTTVTWADAEADTCILLEWLPGSALPRDADQQLYESVSASLRGLNETASLTQYLHDVTVAVQRFTGYERVMVYRFDDDWSGEVVAESVKDSDGPLYLNHRFPASDIPPQARELYLEQPIRVIADVDAPPRRIVGRPRCTRIAC